MYEIETKILGVDSEKIKEQMLELGAKKILDTRFIVDWFEEGGTVSDREPWFLRVRSDSGGKVEITWKSNRTFQGATSKHEEICISVSDHEKTCELFEAIGLQRYAHQEKDRISWTFKDWRFDLDCYPDVEPYLEIEGKSEEHVQEAISILSLGEKKATPEGERKVIEDNFGKNWHDLKFKD